MIFEQPSKMEQLSDATTEVIEPVQTTKIAIVGMDTFFGSCDGLDAFERSIYDGTQHFIPLPPYRWKGIEEQQQLLKDYGFEGSEAPLGAYINEFEINTLRLKIPPNEVDKLNPQQLLILKVADRALRDARLGEGGNVSVIIAAETELSVHQLQQRWNLPWQLQEALMKENASLSSEQLSELETLVQDSIHHPAHTSEFVSYIGNIMASRIAALWNFTGPSFTLSAGENSAFKALEVAQMLLAAGEVEAVVVGAVDLAGGVEHVLWRNQLAKINTGVNTLSYDQKANGWMVGEGAGAVVLKRLDSAKQAQDRIYAVIDAISLVQECATEEKVNDLPPPGALPVTQACQRAFTQTGIKPADISYVEVFGSGVRSQDESEIKGLIQAYQTAEPDLSCAIGSVKANIGHTYAASGIASLIKTALCLYHRYIPATSQWSSPKMPEIWQGSPFYVPSESRPWFLKEGTSKRVAAINGLGLDGTYAHLILSEEPTQKERSSRYLEQMPFYLFPIAADQCSDLLEQLNVLQQTIKDCSSLAVAASQTFAAFQNHQEETYALAILGRNKDELMREIKRAFTGVANAFDTGKDWQTPVGSYFTAKPQGKRGTIAFVYPGAFNSYIGLGRNIFRLFPKVYDDADNHVANIGPILREKVIYPRSLNSLSRRQLEILEEQLIEDALAMLESGMGFASLFTAMMRDYFQLQPHCTFGYSLGEISMMCAQDVWTDYDKGSYTLNSSPLFCTRLSGPKTAVREYWGLPPEQNLEDENFWSTYILIAPVSQVRECLKHETRVYLTHINTPNEVAIAGDTQACQRVIETLKCDAFRAPSDHVIHCDAMRSEYDELVKLNILPLKKIPETVFYSAAEYKPITLDSNSIGHSIAKGICQPLDFPRLINQVYEDGARIFVEAGAGSTCSRWIGETLKQKEHVTVSLNKRGVDDHTSIIKALAKLLSHRVSLDLSPLYCPVRETFTQNSSIFKTITLGGSRISSTMLNAKNNEMFQELSLQPVGESTGEQQYLLSTLEKHEEMNFNKMQSRLKSCENGFKSIDNNNLKTSEQLQSFDMLASSNISHQDVPPVNTKSYDFGGKLNQTELPSNYYQKMRHKTSHINKIHVAFLQTRQESLKQISEIIQLQVACSKQWIDSGCLAINSKQSPLDK